MPGLTVNNIPVTVAEGSTVLDAVNAVGDYIPQLCKDSDMGAIGACRTCLVQVDGERGFPASCSLPASEGMNVSTNTGDVRQVRKGVLELTLGMLKGSTQGHDYKELTKACSHHGIDQSRYEPRQRPNVDDSSPFFSIAMEDCIMCGRCAKGCGPGHQFIGAIDILGSGQDSRIGTFLDEPLNASICTSCGTCLSVCPTGAIQSKGPSLPAAKSVTTTCPYCGVGCGIKLQVNDNDSILEVLDDADNPSSLGMLCVKGRFGTTFVNAPDRLKTPLIKENGHFREASWDEALDLVAERLVEHRGFFATLCSAKATNEDGYIQQKFARLLMQTNNIDHCTRLCHSPSVEAMLTAFGSGATSNSYTDYETAGCIVVAGSDATSNHPVVASRMRRAIVEHGAKLVIINPKRIDLCDYADVWLRPYPGTDVALLNAMAKVILDEGLQDQTFVDDRTEGFAEWHKIVDRSSLDDAAAITGCSIEDIRTAARLYAKPPFSGSCLVWGMGMTQHTNGTANCHSLLNLALIAGQLGRPGTGVSPLRGQNNVQGCGDSGCIPNNLPGYQSTASHAARFGRAWGHPIPSQEGMVVTEFMEEAYKGNIKALYVTGENPLLSEPDLHHAEESLRNLEFLVVQDLFLHETAQIADVVLPAASFAEKDGTFTNSERRVQLVRKAIEPVGRSRPDWEILCDIARRMSSRLHLPLETQFSYTHPSEIMDEMASLTPILAGISYDRLDREGGLQWPCPDPTHPGTPNLYPDTFPRGPRAKFVGFEQQKPAAELPNKRFPLILNTGRLLYHWHGGTMTRRVPDLLARSPDLLVTIHPIDARKAMVKDGQWIVVRSRRGTIEGKAQVTDAVQEGQIFVPFTKLNEHAANFLTNAAFDPTSKIPEYKVCAVRVEAKKQSSSDTY